MQQEWLCETCLADGRVSVPAHADVYSVVNAIERSHAKQSPKCGTPIRGLRVRNVDAMTKAEWRNLRAILRNDAAAKLSGKGATNG